MPAKNRIQNRRGTAALWASTNPVLAQGEWGVETDTMKFKLGDGINAWNSLGYATSGAYTPTQYSLNVSNVFSTSGSFNGSAVFSLDLPSTIARNAQSASKLQTAVTVNGTSFDGSAAVAVKGLVYGTTLAANATFTAAYVSPIANQPASPVDGDAWFAF